MSWGVAGCPNCGAVLVSTVAFRGYEFYCLDCGRSCGFLSPYPMRETPELLAKVDETKAEWRELSAGLIADGGMLLDDCATCKERYEPHRNHATDQELADDRRARSRIMGRIITGATL